MSLRHTKTSNRALFSKRKPVRRKTPANKKQKSSRKPIAKLFTSSNRIAESDSDKSGRNVDSLFRQNLTEAEIQRRKQELHDLRQEILDNRETLPLMEHVDGESNNIVFSRGSVDASLMIVGEAPGAREAESGMPFVGPSGQELETYLKKNGIDPTTHIYVTNVVLVRPPHNRNPTWEEVTAYAPYLRRHIAIIKPKIILCMGRFSSTIIRGGLGDTASLCGGEIETNPEFHDVKLITLNTFYRQQANMGALTLREERFCCQFYISYHPSSILREDTEVKQKLEADPGARNVHPRRDRWEKDFKTVAGALLEPPLEYIDAGELVRDSAPDGFIFNKPSEVFYSASTLTDSGQRDYAPSKGVLEFEVQSLEYHQYSNTFNIYGRTIDNHSVCLEVLHPAMKFWIGHPEITDGLLSNDDLRHTCDELNDELGRIARGRQKYRQMENLRSVNCDMEITQQRDYIEYTATTGTYVQITYHQEDLKYELKKLLETLWPGAKFYESSISPDKQLEFDNNIYIRGWLEVQLDSTLECRVTGKQSLSDLEYTVHAADLKGYSPNPGQSGDTKWERNSPIRVLSLDAEMLNTGGRFPRAEQDPTVSICAYSSTSNRPDGKNYIEKIRNPSHGKSTEFKTTGRSNYDDAVAFAVGSVGAISTEKFHIQFLPNIPNLPVDTVLHLRTGSLEGVYKKPYAVGIRKWNAFIENYQIWTKAVGDRRTQRVLKSKELYTHLAELTERPDGSDPTTNWSDEAILRWEKCANTIRKLWHRRSKKDIRNFTEPTSWDTYFDTVQNEDERLREFGEIQTWWCLFRPQKRVFSFESEEDMMRGFYSYVRQYDADVLTGYNITSFDIPYFIRRVEVLDIRDTQTAKLLSMGRFRDREDRDTIKISSSKATGERVFHTVKVPGRDCYDFMHYMMRDHKLQSYKLESVAQTFLGDTKNNVPYSAIYSLFLHNRERLNDYCLKDAELPQMLMTYLNNVNFLTALARLIGTIPMERLYVDGKQSQVFSCLMRYLRKEGLRKIMPDDNPYSQPQDDGGEEIGYDGAFVFPPKTLGLYRKLLVCLDFASLYPSIIISRNLGHDMAGTAKRMESQGVSLSQCFKTPRRFPVPGLTEQERDDLIAVQHAMLQSAIVKYNTQAPAKAKCGIISRTANHKHLVCSVSTPKSEHSNLEQFLTKDTETPVKVIQNETNGKKDGTFRLVLDVGDFYYFIQPRQLTEAQLQELGISKEDCRLRPGTGEFWVPQFGSRKCMDTTEIREYLIECGLSEENAETAMWCATSGMVPLDQRARYERLRTQLHDLNFEDIDEPVRYFAAVPDIYLPKSDEAALVGTEREMLEARARIKKLMKNFKPGSEMYKKLDSQQLALKILCNSLYGATGVRVGRLAGMHISATVTAEGQRTILETSDECAKKFGSDTQGGDTDSIFAHFPSLQKLGDIYEVITIIDERTGERRTTTRIGEILDFANSLVPPDMSLAFEKAYSSFFAVAKKRAAFVEHMPYWDIFEKCNKFDGTGEINFKGLETKRRDSCIVAQQTITGFLTRLLNEEDSYPVIMQKLVEYTRAQVEKVLDGNVPFHEMLQARQLSKKNYASKLPVTELREKKRKRGEPVPQVGDRLNFVVITGSDDRLFCESVEDPDFVLEHDQRLDYLYVIRKKIEAPIKRFTSKMPNGDQLDQAIFGNLKKRHRRNLQEDDPLAAFVRKLYPCAQCGRNSPTLVCSECGPSAQWDDIRAFEMEKRQNIDDRYNQALQTCRTCMSIGETEEVVCGNVSCAEYFPRRGSFFERKNQDARMEELTKLRSNYGVDATDLEW